MNEEQLEDDKAYIQLFNQNTKLSKRVKEYESLHKKIVKQVCEVKDERAKLRIENKRYREILTSRAIKQLIRLEDKGCFLPEEDREDFLNLKYAVEAMESKE